MIQRFLKLKRSGAALPESSPDLRPRLPSPLRRLRDDGVIGVDDIVVCNLTGHVLKQPEAIRLSEKKFAPIPPTLEALRDQVKRTEC